ncbi:hypothetical protein D3C87_1778750 [compost metagenome]
MVEAHRRPNHPAIGLDFVGNEGVAEIGGGEEAAEPGFGIVDKGRHHQLALVHDQDRPVIGDELGAQRHHEEHQKNPEGPPAAAIGPEIGEAPLVERGEARRPGHRFGQGGLAHALRPSKSRRGSTHM